MLDTILYIMFAGMIVALVAMEADKENFVWPCLAILFAAMCMVSVVSIETGYSYAYENIDNGSVTILSGVRTYSDAAPLAIVFVAIIIIVGALLVERGFGQWDGKRRIT